jgi:hypothetical protein
MANQHSRTITITTSTLIEYERRADGIWILGYIVGDGKKFLARQVNAFPLVKLWLGSPPLNS